MKITLLNILQGEEEREKEVSDTRYLAMHKGAVRKNRAN